MTIRSKRTKWVELRNKVTLLIISTLFSLFLGEVIVRYYLFGSHGFSQTQMESHDSKRWSEILQIPEDSPLFYELKPNVDVLYKFIPFQTNSEGQNDKVYSIKKSDSTIRVAVIGDSYSMGWGVAREDLYHEIIEKQLNSEESSLNFEFINFAVGGYNFENYIDVLETKVLKYSPDIVLIGFCGANDFKYSKGEEFKVYRMNNKRPKGFYASFLLRFVREHIRLWQQKPISPTMQKKHDDYIQYAFLRINGFSKNHNIPIAIAYLHTLYEENNTNRLRVEELAKLNQFNFVDASVSFKDKDRKDYTLNFLDAHPNKKANKLFAKSILDSLDFSTKGDQ